MKSKTNSNSTIATGFINGFKKGTPIALCCIPGAIAFGILAKTASLTAWESVFMSFIVFAGASQFVAVNLFTLGAAIPEILIAVGVLNMRHMMMSSSLAKKYLPNTTFLQKFWMGFEMTDETFSLAAMQKEDYLSSEFVMGLNLPLHFTWTTATYLGWIGTSILPDSVQESMGIAIFAIFMGLLIPSVRKNRAGLIVTAIAMAMSAYIKWTPFLDATINKGVSIMITAGAAALFGAIVFPRKEEGEQKPL
ncbi:MAG: AzlC family ABC transporter permease [Synergistaceae bacterium]|nr:AzlC family ABC transporter permease [Synergistaceae bacterium]